MRLINGTSELNNGFDDLIDLDYLVRKFVVVRAWHAVRQLHLRAGAAAGGMRKVVTAVLSRLGRAGGD